MTVAAIHPRFLEGLGAYFLQLVRIESRTEGQANSTGEPQETWAVVQGLERVGAQIAPIGADREERTASLTNVSNRRTCLLQGAFPEIEPGMRLVEIKTDKIWNIQSAEIDSQVRLTRLELEIVNP